MDSCYEDFRSLEGHRKGLVMLHSSSVHGSHARGYRTLLTEYIHLEDRFRQATAARILARYRLQKLIIDVAHSYNNAPVKNPLLVWSLQLHYLFL